MPITAGVVLFFHWLPLLLNLHNYQCVEKSPGLNECLLTSFNTRLNVTCTDHQLDIRTVDLFKANSTHLPRLKEAWTKCINFQRPPTEHRLKPWTKLEIRLSDNGIASVPDEYFCHLPVHRLVINGKLLNDTRKLGFSPVENCNRQCLTNVQTLRIEQTDLKSVYKGSFCGSDTLIEFHLCHSGVTAVDSDAFIRLKSLKTLDLNNNNISTLPTGVFRHQQNTLLHLDMSNNRLEGRSILELTNLTNLEILNLEGNRIEFLPVEVMKHLTQLSELKIGHNLLTDCAGVIPLLKNLQSIDVQSNRIERIQINFPPSSKLRILHIQNNPISRTRYHYYSSSVNVTHVNYSNTSIGSVPTYLKSAIHIKSLILSRNYIYAIDIGTFDAAQDIDLIDLSYNDIINITNVFTNCTVKQLYLDHNRITTKFTFDDFSFKLTLLSITHNRIRTINVASNVDITDFQWSLKTLNLSHNHLNQIADGSFDHLTVLNVLNLEHNNLSHISQNIFKNLNSLTQLFLSHNQIKIIEPNAFPSQLQTLHLDNNKLVDYSVWQLDNLTDLTKMSLHANKWSCECNYIDKFRNWLQNNSHIVEENEKVVCVLPIDAAINTTAPSQCV